MRCAVWLAALWVIGLLTFSLRAEDAPKPGKIRVVIWNERQPAQKTAYDGGFLDEAIAKYLKSKEDFTVTQVALDDPDQGLAPGVLENCDVLIWWGHIRNKEVKEEVGKKIAGLVKDGKLSLIALHSAHWARPFIQCMWDVTTQNALKKVPEDKRANAKIEYIYPTPFKGPKKTDPVTPSSEIVTNADGTVTLKITQANCCFPGWRADGKPSHVTILAPEHPIAKGLPEKFDIAQTEMYDETFHVPEPDQVILEEKWDAGEHFRSGMVWTLGKGKIFYFRPGHETFPVYKAELPLKILENACRWAKN